MKIFLTIFVFVSSLFGISLTEIRNDFESASKSEKNTTSFYKKLNAYTGGNQTILAYKGASKIMIAKFIKDKEKRKNHFKEGAQLIDNAISYDSKNLENYLIRLIIQENIPKFIKYNQNIEQDKLFIVENFAFANKEVQVLVKNYAKKYHTFTPQQLKKLN